MTYNSRSRDLTVRVMCSGIRVVLVGIGVEVFDKIRYI